MATYQPEETPEQRAMKYMPKYATQTFQGGGAITNRGPENYAGGGGGWNENTGSVDSGMVYAGGFNPAAGGWNESTGQYQPPMRGGRPGGQGAGGPYGGINPGASGNAMIQNPGDSPAYGGDPSGGRGFVPPRGGKPGGQGGYDPSQPSTMPVSDWGRPPRPPSPTPQIPTQPGSDPRKEQLFNTLMQRAQQGTQIDRNDPNIRQQVDPFAAAQERSRRNYVADAAERMPKGNLEGTRRMAAERAGQATGMLESNLVGQELTNRRSEIAQALQSQGAMLSEDQKERLQRELGNMDAAIKQNQTNVTQELGRGELGLGRGRLGLDRELGRGNLGLERDRLGVQQDLGYRELDKGLFDSMLNNEQFWGDLDTRRELGTADQDYRNRQLSQQWDQFMAQMGFDETDRARYYDMVASGRLGNQVG